MIDPRLVDGAKQNGALDIAELSVGEQFLFLLVNLVRTLDQLFFDIEFRKAVKILLRIMEILFGRKIAEKSGTERIEIPVVGDLVVQIGSHRAADIFVDHAEDCALDILALQNLAALTVDLFALLIHNVVEHQNRLAALEVLTLQTLLRRFDGVGKKLCVDRSVLVDTHFADHVDDALASEQTHKVVLERQAEARGAGVALTSRTAAELVVDTAAFMTLGAENKESADFGDPLCLGRDLFFEFFQVFGIFRTKRDDLFVRRGIIARCGADLFLGASRLAHFVLCHEFGVAAEHNVGSASRHVGRDGDGGKFSRLCDDLGFFFMIFCVEHRMRNSVLFQNGGQFFGFFDGDRTDEDRLTLFVTFLDLRKDRIHFALFADEHRVGHILSDHGAVGRDLHDVKVINLAEFFLLGKCRTGHARELVIHAEIVLEGDGGKRFRFVFDLDALFCLDCLMQTV